MKRTRLADSELPEYTDSEELFHVLSHAAGALLGVVALVWCLALADNTIEVISSIVYSVTMIILYVTSGIYHGLRDPHVKRVFRVLDHCTIYLYIAGTYTMVALCALRLESEPLAWLIFAIEWSLAAVAITLTAIDLKRYEVFSLACYIIMGWAAVIAVGPLYRALGVGGSLLLLGGGISYTVGSVVYVVGKKKQKPYAHSAFHVFTLLGSFLQFLGIILYVL